MQKIDLTLEQIEGNEIVIREGRALDPVAPKQVQINGDIRTVSSFLSKRKIASNLAGQQFIERDKAIVEVDKEEMTITLKLDPEYQYGTVVTAKLELNPDLAEFHINKNKQFSQRELVQLLKFSRLYFEDAGKHGDLLKAYQAFTAKTYTDLAGDNDNRGNKNFAFSKKVETGLPASFIMNLPIFKGQDPKRFMVEICLDVTDAAASFWFESIELKELQDIESDKILKDELKLCEDYVIVWK